ncbi:MAG: hypothetical protein EA353_07485 [Puniceicoccaceae bacterium]|nr:MAG: hypothetical protein EA353_07485 [Puniceicoccaceae bacterium]
MNKKKKNIQPHWRPNFVNQSELPDIKVVRTDFIINIIAVACALSLVSVLVQREYRTKVLTDTIGRMEQTIEDGASRDRTSLQHNQRFRQSAEYVLEVGKFMDAPFLAHEMIRDLSLIKPADLIFRTLSLTEEVTGRGNSRQIGYRINIAGDALSLTALDDFKRILSTASQLQIPGFTIDVDENIQGRDERTGIFPYRMTIIMTPGAKPGAKAGGAS